jgi:nucleotide-binding universal stress UspA family protein
MKDILVVIDGMSDPVPEVQLGCLFASATKGNVVLGAMENPVDENSGTNEAFKGLSRFSERESCPAISKNLMGPWKDAILNELISGVYGAVVLSSWMTTHSPRLFSRSIANEVILESPVPIAIAKGSPSKIGKILICDSGDTNNPLMDRFSQQMSELLDSAPEITILHVMSQITAYPGIRGKQLRADAEELMEGHTPEGEILEHDLDILERTKTRPRPKIRHGLVVDEIIQEAADANDDLIVIGAHRGEGWQHFLLYDIAREIIMAVDKPVLVIH